MRRSEVLRKQQIIMFGIVVTMLFILFGSIIFGTIHAQAAPSVNSYKYYTSIQVQSGDSLWNIANAYITDDYKDITAYIDEICEVNHISADSIHAGQYLTIPYYSNDYLE